MYLLKRGTKGSKSAGTGFRFRAASKYTMLLVNRSCVSNCAPLRLVRELGTASARRGMSSKCREGMQVRDSGSSGVSCKTGEALLRLFSCIMSVKMDIQDSCKTKTSRIHDPHVLRRLRINCDYHFGIIYEYEREASEA